MICMTLLLFFDNPISMPAEVAIPVRMNTFSEYQNVTIRVGTLNLGVHVSQAVPAPHVTGIPDCVYELMRTNREILG